jgi:hypothetical protein
VFRARDIDELAMLHTAVQFAHNCVTGGEAKIACEGVSLYLAHVGHGFLLHGIIASISHCFLSAFFNFVLGQAERPARPRFSYQTLRLVAVPYVQFEGACAH